MVNVIEKIKNYVVHVADPMKIILFGSVANGSYTVNSDIDILVITQNKTLNTRYLSNQIRSFIKEAAFAADVIIIDQRFFDTAKNDGSTFIGAIIKTGKIVYEKMP